MVINNDKRIKDIQEEFSSIYPGLKLEFFKEKHNVGQGSKNESKLDRYSSLSSICKNIKASDLIIRDDMTVAELEKQFEESYSLNVQVYRKSNELWLQTINTDNWTIEKQNLKGIHSQEPQIEL